MLREGYRGGCCVRDTAGMLREGYRGIPRGIQGDASARGKLDSKSLVPCPSACQGTSNHPAPRTSPCRSCPSQVSCPSAGLPEGSLADFQGDSSGVPLSCTPPSCKELVTPPSPTARAKMPLFDQWSNGQTGSGDALAPEKQQGQSRETAAFLSRSCQGRSRTGRRAGREQHGRATGARQGVRTRPRPHPARPSPARRHVRPR